MNDFGSFQPRSANKENAAISGLYTEDKTIPLQGVSVHVDVLEMASRVTIKQRYKNTMNHAIEATYCFPIEPGAAITGFNANVGGRRIEGIVKNRDDAFETYDEAIEQGDVAFLLDQEQTDVFTASVGNLKPEEEAEIEIVYVARLDVYGKKVRFTLPTSLSPRYAPEGSDPVKVDRISPPIGFQVSYGLSVEVHIRHANDLTSFSSPSHKIEIKKEKNELFVFLHKSEAVLDRDFILEFEAESFAQPRAVISSHLNGERAVMVNWIPEIPDESLKGNEGIIFILDCSGSMSGSSIREAKEALDHCIRGMKDDTPFNVIVFGSKYRLLFDKMELCTPENRNSALSQIKKIDADLGGTEILAPLHAAYAMMKNTFSNIFLLTDGEVYNVDEVIALARKNRSQARIFSFGIGYGPSHALIREIAGVSGGGAVFISPDESVKEKVVRQFTRFSTQRVTDISINWGDLTVTNIPSPLPPVFSGEPFTIFGLVKDGDTKEIGFTGKAGEGTIRFTAPITDIGENDLIPVLWARQWIQELETGDSAISGSRQVERKREKIEKEIENIALKFQLMSSRTSFVVVLEREDEGKSFEKPVFTRVPVQLTRGWHGIKGMPAIYDLPQICSMKMGLDVTREKRRRSIGTKGMTDKGMSNKEERMEYLKKKMEELKSKDRHFDKTPHPERKILSEKEIHPIIYNALNNYRGVSGEFSWDESFLTRLSLPIDKLNQLTEKMEGVTEENKETVLMTVIALLLLERLPDGGEKISGLIEQTKQWLKTQARNARIDGKPVREVLESNFDFEKLVSMIAKKKQKETS